jgi:hypothetical protein
MDSADGTARRAGGGERRADIGGDAHGPVIAGDHNLLITAEPGATVTVQPARERPRPVRRERVALLPRRIPVPAGRDAQLTALSEAVRSGTGLVQLWGRPGTGKTTLLRHAAHRLERGRDGTVFLNAAHGEPRDLAQQLFEACYEAPGYAPSVTELRRLMTGLRVIVYLDDLALSAGRLAELTDAAPDAVFVFTSPERSLWNEGTALEIGGLDRAAGLDLLARELGRPLRDAELADATELWRAAGGRPLLLLRAAALARTRAHGTARLPRPGEVAALIPALLDQLGEAEGRVLHLLATLGDAELDPALIGTLTDIPDPADICERLTALGLLTASERGYRCAADTVPLVRQRHPAPFPADRLCGAFTEWAALPSTTAEQVAAQSRSFEVAAELAEYAGHADLAVALAQAIAPALAASLRFGVWGRVLGRGWWAARRAGDPRAEAYFTHQAAVRAMIVGQLVAAGGLLARALLLWREVGDDAGIDAALEIQPYVTPDTAAAMAAPPDPLTPSAASAPGPAPVDPATGGAPYADAGAPYADGGATYADGGAGSYDVVAHMTDLCGQTAANAAGAVPSLLSPVATATATAGAGGAAAGAGGAAGVGAAGGTAAALQGGWLVALIVGLVATVLAVVVGGIALSQRDSSDPRQHAGDNTFGTNGSSEGSSGGGTSGAGTADDTSEDTTDPDDEEPPNTDLAGVWVDGLGTEVEFTTSGSGAYHALIPTDCGPVDIELSADGGEYEGTQTMYEYNQEDGSCLGTGVIGHLLMSIEISPDGTQARVDKESAPGQPSCAVGCEPAILVRKS